MPLPTIFGPDVWGGIQIPVLPQTDVSVTANDPCLYYIGTFLKAFAATDENLKEQWDVSGIAPGQPPIRTVVIGRPNDGSFNFRNDALPALFIFRDLQETSYLGDSIGKDDSIVKMVWVYPLGEPANNRPRANFQNALVKGLFAGIERGRTPGWIVDGETESYALGAPLWTANTFFSTGFQCVPNPFNGLLYNCTVAGETSGTQPTFPATTGATVVDGGVTWQCAGAWTPLGSSVYKYAAFAQFWIEKSKPTVVRVTNLQGKPISTHPAVEITCSLFEDLQFGTSNRVANDPNNGLEITTSPSQTASPWAPLTKYDLNAGPVYPTAPNSFSYVCTVGGISAASEPTWPTTPGVTVTDGTCTWKCVGPVTNTDDLIV